jgi:phosphoribosylformylglycinamidine synthase
MMHALAPTVALHDLDDATLARRLAQQGVHLRCDEARRLVTALERDPTRAELYLFNSMWSEHCSYKSTRGLLARLPTQAPNVVLGPGADAGIVRLPRPGAGGSADLATAAVSHPDAPCIAIGHESHNHPSQLLPFEGAATGIGGIVRDVYCMGADVIGVLDALRFGDPDGTQAESVRQIARGVVHGIWSYGNALGVPNMGGDVEFDAEFDDNCLVNVVAVGLMREADLVPSVAPAAAAGGDYVLVLVGKPTDDSGLGGAAFASGVLDTDESTQERGAVQLPDPFFKRVLTEANKAALAYLRGTGVEFAMKDLGAAGLGGAASEVAAGAGLGLDLDLDAVHRVHDGEAAHVLLVAETQERYVFAVPAAVADRLVAIYEHDFELGAMVRGAGARVVGRFVSTPRFRVFQSGHVHVDVASRWITDAPRIEWPRAPRAASAPAPVATPITTTGTPLADLRAIVRSVAAASRHVVFQHYDSDVQGRTLLRPGDGDAGVLVLAPDSPLGIAVAVGGSARGARRDARRTGAAAVCEAVRNVVAVGATPWALTDCLNFGSPETPAGMQDLSDAVDGLAAAATALGLRGFDAPLPFVSGNVSLYNESRAGRAIPPSPIVACLGVLCDFARARGVHLDAAGDVLVQLGEPAPGLGSSLWAQVAGRVDVFAGDTLPGLDLERERARADAVQDAFAAGLVRACHDVGDGGLLLALVEMAWARGGEATRGIRCEVDTATPSRLFGESPGYVCAVRSDDWERFVAVCARRGVPAMRVGSVLAEPMLELVVAGVVHERVDLGALAREWRGGLRRVFDAGVTA